MWAEFNERCEIVKKQEEHDSGKYLIRIITDLNTTYHGGMGETLFNVVTFDWAKTSEHDELVRDTDTIKKCNQILSDNKNMMTHEHKQECFNAIKKAREFLDKRWSDFNKLKSDEHAKNKIAWEAKQAKHAQNQIDWVEKQAKHAQNQVEWEARQAKKENWRERTSANIELNREKHAKAVGDLSRMEDHLSELRSKLYDAKGSYYDRVSGWIDECETQIQSKKEWIEKLETWIEEGEEKLNG